MNARSLRASINQTAVGTLQEVNGLWSFQYAQDWLGNPHRFALSPHLPLKTECLLDGASQRPVQWYFDNLLPEEGQRVLLAGDVRLDAADAFGLLTRCGAESAGSVGWAFSGRPDSDLVFLALLHWMRGFAVLEGLFGIALAGAFLVSLTRCYIE